MIWSLYANLGNNMWYKEDKEVNFSDEAWEKMVETAVETGINQIVLDLGEGVQYGSHPELAYPGAWSRQRVHKEVRRLRNLGIELIPKMNFSATHAMWLGEYRRMMSTKIYYQVCRDLITEVYTLFEQPTYIHLGMDEEEDPQFVECLELVAYRRGELIWHDLQFLCDCVRDQGATPWIWADPCVYHPEEFRKRVDADDIVLSPWYYYSVKREHYTPVNATQRQIEAHSKEPFKSMKLTYMEEEPYNQMFLKEAIPTATDYKVIPCVSECFECKYNYDDMFDLFKNQAPQENVLGYLTAPWRRTRKENLPGILNEMYRMKEMREKYYSGE